MERDDGGVDFCRNCGFKITSRASVCIRCGAEVSFERPVY